MEYFPSVNGQGFRGFLTCKWLLTLPQKHPFVIQSTKGPAKRVTGRKTVITKDGLRTGNRKWRSSNREEAAFIPLKMYYAKIVTQCKGNQKHEF